MKQKITKLITIIIIFGLVSCVKNIRNFNPNSVDSDEGIVIGKINVVYNGEEYNENCTALFGKEDSQALTQYKLDETGLVALALKKGDANLVKISCSDTMSGYVYKIEGASFQNSGGRKATYFGDVTVYWDTKGGFNTKTCLICLGPIGTVIRDSSFDGDIKMKVVNNSGTITEYKNVTGENPGNVQTSLMSEGR